MLYLKLVYCSRKYVARECVPNAIVKNLVRILTNAVTSPEGRGLVTDTLLSIFKRLCGTRSRMKCRLLVKGGVVRMFLAKLSIEASCVLTIINIGKHRVCAHTPKNHRFLLVRFHLRPSKKTPLNLVVFFMSLCSI